MPVPVRRTIVYLVTAIALLVVLWALIEGGERDLWNVPTAKVLPLWLDAAGV